MTRLTCHCGAVEVQFTPNEPLTNARRCDCSFCVRRGAAVVFVNAGDLMVTKGAHRLTLYQWGTFQEEHYFCTTCGIYTHHQHANATKGYAVNLAAIDGIIPRNFDPIPWIDGKNYTPANFRKNPT